MPLQANIIKTSHDITFRIAWVQDRIKVNTDNNACNRKQHSPSSISDNKVVQLQDPLVPTTMTFGHNLIPLFLASQEDGNKEAQHEQICWLGKAVQER